LTCTTPTSSPDVQDLDALVAAFDGCETVIHLAGIVSVTTSREETSVSLFAGPGVR
jgi:nucleoside-diphosphate-sugar epimerase